MQVSTEFRDGKWVATARRVPAPSASSDVRPLDSYAGYAPGSGDTTNGDTDTFDEEDHSEGPGETDTPDVIARYRTDHPSPDTIASKRCEGHYVSDLGALITVKGRTATVWTKAEVQQGDVTGDVTTGEPNSNGLLFRRPDGSDTSQFYCYRDHIMFVFDKGKRATFSRTTAATVEETLTAWTLER